MPDLGGVAAAPSIVSQIYCVENGQFFVEVFAVDLALGCYKPAFLLILVATDPENDGHKRILAPDPPSPQIAVSLATAARLSVSR